MYNSGGQTYTDKVIEVSIPLVLSRSRTLGEDETQEGGLSGRKLSSVLEPPRLPPLAFPSLANHIDTTEVKSPAKAAFLFTESEQMDS